MSLRTIPKVMLLHVRDRWYIENCWQWLPGVNYVGARLLNCRRAQWPRDPQRREDTHRYRETIGVQIIARLPSLAMKFLLLDGFWSITEGLAALSHDIRGLLSILGWREPLQALNSACPLMSPG